MTDDRVPLTMAALKEAADQLAYLNAPVEARLRADTLIALKIMLPPSETPSHSLVVTGLRLIVDPELPPWLIEFRDQNGDVVSSYNLFPGLTS